MIFVDKEERHSGQVCLSRVNQKRGVKINKVGIKSEQFDRKETGAATFIVATPVLNWLPSADSNHGPDG